ncbi:MAG: hypothetical protein CLLPBCKN_000956 [Chroococcidiopsis cubana SAG 39.79]|uniref:hypothetical protein n=1 Tax=Chroococcidiopsis cubana TaxID=171392 RepID=UPI0013150622|nr:hypothetical protein [Chroococcidiopsis cubana]MDZ4871568.1 hypothetical protein [Chroococcidiopsis cubana SAG 39.79]
MQRERSDIPSNSLLLHATKKAECQRIFTLRHEDFGTAIAIALFLHYNSGDLMSLNYDE